METFRTTPADEAAITAAHRTLVLGRQDPLRRRYRRDPREAAIVDGARAGARPGDDPFHSDVDAGSGPGRPWRVGIHRAVGGFHDAPNPGDVLCAALAACLDTTLRILAARLAVPIVSLRVSVTGDVDVRGTLSVDRKVPVGMQRMHCRVDLRPAADVPSEALRRLVAAAEHACVVLQTLRYGVPVELDAECDADARPAGVPAGTGAAPARNEKGG